MNLTSKMKNNLTDEQIAPLNPFAKQLLVKLPSNITIHTKRNIEHWRDDFERLRLTIVASSKSNALNYSEKYFNLDAQTEITLIKVDNQIIAFSSLREKDLYPNRTGRILNRTWKRASSDTNLSVGFLRIMASLQIAAAQSRQLRLVFCTMQERKKFWWRRFLKYGNDIHPGWVTYPGMVKVCNGPTINCWQSMSYLPLVKGAGPEEFNTLSFSEWEAKLKSDPQGHA